LCNKPKNVTKTGDSKTNRVCLFRKKHDIQPAKNIANPSISPAKPNGYIEKFAKAIQQPNDIKV